MCFVVDVHLNKFKIKFKVTIKYCEVYCQLVLWLIIIMYYLYSFLLFVYPVCVSCVKLFNAFWKYFLIPNKFPYCLNFAVFGDNTNLYFFRFVLISLYLVILIQIFILSNFFFFWHCVQQGCSILVLNGQHPAKLNSNFPTWNIVVILKTFIILVQVCLIEVGAKLLYAAHWPSSSRIGHPIPTISSFSTVLDCLLMPNASLGLTHATKMAFYKSQFLQILQNVAFFLKKKNWYRFPHKLLFAVTCKQ